MGILTTAAEVLQKMGPHCTAHLHSTTLTMTAAHDTSFNGVTKATTMIGFGPGSVGSVTLHPTQPSQHKLIMIEVSYDVLSLLDDIIVAIFISRLEREVSQTLHPY